MGAGDASLISEFFKHSRYDIIVTEYTLAGHGAGFDYTSFAGFMVHQFSALAGGSMVWNFDVAPWMRPWGLVAARKENPNDAWVDWRRIFQERAKAATTSGEDSPVHF